MLYLDTSALVKLVRTERETTALREAVADHHLVSSDIAVTELHRVVARYQDSEGHERADELLGVIGLVALGRPLLERAGRLPPPRLRSLDAIHLAAGGVFAADINAVVTYDGRMAEAALLHGLEVWSPGASV